MRSNYETLLSCESPEGKDITNIDDLRSTLPVVKDVTPEGGKQEELHLEVPLYPEDKFVAQSNKYPEKDL